MSKHHLDSQAHVITHPLIEHKLTVLRNKDTKPMDFRRVMGEISGLLAYETTRDLKLTNVAIETPIEKMDSPVVSEDLVIVSIMRAGNGMLDGLMTMLPFAKVGHIGIYRDKLMKTTVEYYFKLPQNVEGKRILLADPLIATGDTVLAAIERLKQYNVGPIRVVCLLISPVGLARLKERYPDVDVCCLKVERGLNDYGYILPGLGDAGDRLYGTL